MGGGGAGYGHQGPVDIKARIWQPIVIICTLSLCFTDTLTTISLKIQGTKYKFRHSGLQTMLLFLGEYLNLIVFAIPMFSSRFRTNHFRELKKNAITYKQQIKITKLWAALPALLECMSSGMYFTSLFLLPASISNMLQGAQIVATCIFSKIINNNPILCHHYIGITLSTIGFAIIGLGGFLGTQDESFSDMKYTTEGYIFGLLCIGGNLVLHSIQTNVEEKIMRIGGIPAQRMVGLEGLFGVAWMFFIITCLQWIDCPNPNVCEEGGFYEDAYNGVKQAINDPWLLFWCGATIFAIFLFNLSGMILIQKVNAVYKVFWDNTMSIFVWGACVAIGFEEGSLSHLPMQLGGYALLMIGNLTYNEIIPWRFCGLDRDLFDKQDRKETMSRPLLPGQKGSVLIGPDRVSFKNRSVLRESKLASRASQGQRNTTPKQE